MTRLPAFVFPGATSVVTGAASGMGEQLARQLADRGSDLVLLDRTGDRLTEIAAEITAAHPQRAVETHTVDLGDADALREVAQRIRAAHPQVDLLVNNAGVALGGLFEQMTLQEFDDVMAVNFRAPVALTHHLLPALLATPGAHLVNTSSVFGLIAPPGQTAYCSSKFALRGWSESMRSELAPHRVGVTTVHPGGIATAIARTSRAAGGLDERDAERGRALADRFLTYPADRAATDILEAVRRRRPRLLIAASARIPDVLQRMFPARYTSVFALVQSRLVTSGFSSRAVKGSTPHQGSELSRPPS